MKFKVVIATRNAADYLDLCLYSLKKYALEEHEYHIILDDCQDHTEEVCKKYQVNYYSVNFHNPYKVLNYVEEFLDLNKDFYFFLSADDMFASPNWDRNMLAHHKKPKDAVWASQLTDYLLYQAYQEALSSNPSLTLQDFAVYWGKSGINMDFGECGTTYDVFNEEIFLHKYNILNNSGYYYHPDHSVNEYVRCNANLLILSSFYKELGGWPDSTVQAEDPRCGNNDLLFQDMVQESGGHNIVPKDVLFFHFGGRNINRDKRKD